LYRGRRRGAHPNLGDWWPETGRQSPVTPASRGGGISRRDAEAQSCDGSAEWRRRGRRGCGKGYNLPCGLGIRYAPPQLTAGDAADRGPPPTRLCRLRMKKTPRTLVGRVALFAMALVAAIAGGLVCISIYTAGQAEKRLHATNLMTGVVTEFIEQEHRWPASWEDLKKAQAGNVPSMYRWPTDVSDLRELVSIDFDIALSSVASQSTDSFDAVAPSGPCYPYKDYGYVEALLNKAQRRLANASNSPNTPGNVPAPPNR